MQRPQPDFARQRLSTLDYVLCILAGAIAVPILFIMGWFFFPLP
jgi:hypothetical protein